jgi:hypothetical protein
MLRQALATLLDLDLDSDLDLEPASAPEMLGALVATAPARLAA